MIKENAKIVTENPDYYRLRQQITEHPFGTLKRQRGFTYTLVRGKEKVLGEVGLMFIGYNLTRCISVLGAEKLIEALKKCLNHYILRLSGGLLSRFRSLKQSFDKCTFGRMLKFYHLSEALFHPKWIYLSIN